MGKILNIIIIFLLASTVQATNYYVSPTGNDLADGLSESTAWATIDNGDLQGILNPGDTVKIAYGLYNITSSIILNQSGTELLPIVYEGYGSGSVIIDGSGLSINILNVIGSYNTISHVTVTNSIDNGFEIEGTNNIIHHCIVTNIGTYGIHLVSGADSNIFVNNTLFKCSNIGIYPVNSVKTTRAINNVICASTTGIWAPPETIAAHNNILDCTNSYFGGVSDSAGGMSIDPQFTDTASGDFTLLPGSPCINNGMDCGLSYYGSAPDMGAVEYISNTYYVSPTGNDLADGLSESTAWATIDRGDVLGIILPGDTIKILPGIYSLSATNNLTISGTLLAPIVYTSTGVDSVVLNYGWSGNEPFVITGRHTILDGIRITNANKEGIKLNIDSCIIRNCVIDSLGNIGIRIYEPHNVVSNNIIYDCGNEGIKGENSADSCLIYNNTVYRNSSHGIEFMGGSVGSRIFNNMIVENKDGIRSPVENICGFNNVWNNTDVAYNSGIVDSAGGISVDPIFSDSANGDFSLKWGSDCIDAGLDIGYTYLGLAPDMGAVEYIPTPGDVFWVSPTGSDLNNGLDSTTAWASINRGDELGLLDAGDTVKILNGNYTITSTPTLSQSGSIDNPIIYIGENSTSTVFDAALIDTGMIVNGSFISIENITINNAQVVNVVCNGLEYCLYGCRILGSGDIGIHATTSGRICKTVIAGNTNIGAFLDVSDSVFVRNNTFYNNNIFALYHTGTISRISNNIFDTHDTAVHAPFSLFNLIVYNDYFQNTVNVSGGSIPGMGTLYENPIFVDSANYDFRLQAGSPLIDQGVDVGFPYNGLAPDMGAFEFTQSNTVYWVSPSGNDLNDGLDSTTAWLTIDRGDVLSILQPGDTVNILTGTYNPTSAYTLSTSGLADSPIVYRKYGSGEALLDGSGSIEDIIQITGSHLVIDGLNIENGTSDGIDITSDSCIIQDCNIHIINEKGINALGIGHLFLRNCITYTSVAGIEINDEQNNCYNNTIVSPGVRGIHYIASIINGRAFNNIVMGANEGIRGSSTITIGFNNLWMTSSDYTAGAVDSAGGKNSDPIFSDTANGDFTLTLGSPCIDSGLYIGYPFSGTAPDIGAFENLVSNALSYIQIEFSDGTPFTTDTTLSTDNDTTILYCRGYDSSNDFLGNVYVNWILTDTLALLSDPVHFSSTLELTHPGSMQIVAELTPTLVDTSAILTISTGIPVSLLISPDSTIISADSTINFALVSYDADGNETNPSVIPTWSIIGDIGTINGAGVFTPTTADTGRVVATFGLIADTTKIITVAPGNLNRLHISPDSTTIKSGDSLQFFATGYDADSNITTEGIIDWQVLGNIGSIDSTGFFMADRYGLGKIIGVSSLGAIVDTTEIITVEALTVSSIPYGDQYVHPYDSNVTLLGLQLENSVSNVKYIDQLIVHNNSSGYGNMVEVRSNVESIGLYLDTDGDFIYTAGDSLLEIQPFNNETLTFTFDSLPIAAADSIALFVNATISGSPHDGDSIDIFVSRPEIIPIDLTPVIGSNMINSLGYTIIDGFTSDQITLTPSTVDTMDVIDSLYHILTIDLPKNGYADDTISILSIVNSGSAQASDFDSILLYKDDGDNLFTSPMDENRIGLLTFTGDRWSRSGILAPLSGSSNRFYLVAKLSSFPTNNATCQITIPENGIQMISGNDGPLDMEVTSSKSIIIQSEQTVTVEPVTLSDRPIIPGDESDVIWGARLFNGTPAELTLHELTLTGVGIDPDASLAQWDSQFDSVGIYLSGDVNNAEIGPEDSLIATAMVINGDVVFDTLALTMTGNGGNAELLLTAWIDLTNAKNDNTIGFELTNSSALTIAPISPIAGTFPVGTTALFTIDAFPAEIISFTSTSTNTIFGGDLNKLILDFTLPANGYNDDVLGSIEIHNNGTLVDDVISSLYLFVDKAPIGFGDEDSLLAEFKSDVNGWIADKIDYSVIPGGERFYLTADIIDKSFEGGTLIPVIPTGAVQYNSGMIGPDDLPVTSGEEILVFPSNRVTSISIPLGTNTIYPGSVRNRLLTFALYNGYIGQSRHLTRLAVMNMTKTQSDQAWADTEIGQLQLYYDNNHNRLLDNDSLIGSGFFTDGHLSLTGMNIELPPESLSYFFITSAMPLTANDNDSLAISINEVSDFGFAEPVNLNGDMPLTRGGYLVIDGSVEAQYESKAVPTRSLSPGDSNVVLYSFMPAINGDRIDTLQQLFVENSLDADEIEIATLSVWSDSNEDVQWQPTDQHLSDFTYTGSQWVASGLTYEMTTSSKSLIIVANISDSARTGRSFRGQIPVNGCNYASDNDGPLDQPLSGNATFTISSSALQLTYGQIRSTYSVGEQIVLPVMVTNRSGINLDSVVTEVNRIGDLSAVSLDSANSGPMSIISDETQIFTFYYTAAQPGGFLFDARAIATTLNDTSVVIQSDSVIIQNVPSGVQLSLQNFMPTAVARGQQNVFPLTIRLSHPDTTSAAPIEVSNITLRILDDMGNPQNASAVLSRLILADAQNSLSIISPLPDLIDVNMSLSPSVTLNPGDTTVLVLLMDIDNTASATSLMMGIESLSAVSAVDANTNNLVTVLPSGSLPLRTNSCRIDDPATTLAVANITNSINGVNAGQDNIGLLNVGLRHPGTIGMSQVQLIGVSLRIVSGTDTLPAADVADRIAIYRSGELLGELTGLSLQNEDITVGLGSGLTINPDARDSLTVALSINPFIAVDSFRVVFPDSAGFDIRDVVSGSEVTAVTDSDILATGSVFPLSSNEITVYQPAESMSFCLVEQIPATVVAGTDSVPLLSLELDYDQPVGSAPVRFTHAAVVIVDDNNVPLDPGQLFDRTGYRIDGGLLKYYVSMTLINGTTVFPFSDTGIVLHPGESVTLDLVGDIESDVPYENFRILMESTDLIERQDQIDTTASPVLATTVSCTSSLPFASIVSSIFRPADAPQFNPADPGVRIASPGLEDFTLGGGKFAYNGTELHGDIAFSGLKTILFKNNGVDEVAVSPSQVFSTISLFSDESLLNTDSLLINDTITMNFSPVMTITHGMESELIFTGDIKADAVPGNYTLKLIDSTAFALADYHLATSIYPLVTGVYPITLGQISIAAADLQNSFANYPNPFIPSNGPTTLTYVLDDDAHIDLELYTITGEPVAQLADNEFRAAGPHQDQSWNGYNDAGLMVTAGTYFCRLTVRYLSGATETVMRKVAVVR